jgi:hypothetical protein
MQTADWAFIVSLCSVVIALFSVLWNIWSKFIYPKPTVRVGFSHMAIVGSEEEILTLSATNMGPISVTLHSAIVRKKRKWLRKWLSRMRTYGILLPLHDYPFRKDHTIGPFSGGLPKTVEVGRCSPFTFLRITRVWPATIMTALDLATRLANTIGHRRETWSGLANPSARPVTRLVNPTSE